MITAYEAARLTQHTPQRDAQNATMLAKQYLSLFTAFTDDQKLCSRFIWFLYNAGRVEGIRSERARRRRQA